MRGKYIAIIVIVATGLAVWIAVDLWRPVSQNLRQFDPEEVARLDTDMWRSYYDRERFAEHARYRAEAMVLRDHRAEANGASESDWQTIHGLLRHSWTSLWHALNEADWSAKKQH